MKKMVVVAVLALGLVLMNMPAFALSLGTNITIWDGSGAGEGVLYGGEDGEVEPGCVDNQSWDLEGFFLKGTTLTMVGGFDFADSTQTYPSGDIFLDIDGDYEQGYSQSGNGVGTISGNLGYEYVLDLDFNNDTYNVFSLNSSSLLSVYYSQNTASNPWRYGSGGTAVAGYADKTLSYKTYADDDQINSELSDTTLEGGWHNAVAISLGFLDPGTDFTAHFTMKCGNDNLMGQGTAPVPEPQTLLLMGIGLLGLAFVGRKKLGERA